MNTLPRVGQPARWTFDLVSDRPVPDSLEILNFTHDGSALPLVAPGQVNFVGGPFSGDLLLSGNPAPRSLLGNSAFLNSVIVPFDSLGSTISFSLRLPQIAPPANGTGDQVSLFCYRNDSTLAFTTADELGAHALFAIGVTADAGGELSVFYPMSFVPPDSLLLDLTGVGVPTGSILTGRLRLLTIAPNPSAGRVDLNFDIPSPGGVMRVRIYDIAGRVIAEPFRGLRTGGSTVVRWTGLDKAGRRAPAGVYIIRADLSGQTVARRFSLVR